MPSINIQKMGDWKQNMKMIVIDWQSSGGFLYQTVSAGPVSFWWINGAKYTSKSIHWFKCFKFGITFIHLANFILFDFNFYSKVHSQINKNFSYSCQIQQNERDHEIFVYSNSVTCKRPSNLITYWLIN